VRARLPEAMQPSHFVTLDALPLTANGKVARDGLPEAGIVETSASDESAPRSGIEAVVAEIWRRMLGVHTVGRNDDFFALGGDSLLVYRMLLAVRAARAVEVPAEAFLQCPTVAGLAQAIDTLPLGDLADADVETLLAEVETLSEVEAAALLGAVDDREGRAAERGDA
jgi:myxalamid-type nonribosomal peptide synthetase MxaA